MATNLGPLWAILEGIEREHVEERGGDSQVQPGTPLWWWAGDEAGARRRFRERFGREATVMALPQPGIVALGPVVK